MTLSLTYGMRPITLVDEPFLWEMLYQAIYVTPGTTPPSRDILHHPKLRRYVQNWGQPHDLGMVAIVSPEYPTYWRSVVTIRESPTKSGAQNVPLPKCWGFPGSATFRVSFKNQQSHEDFNAVLK